MIWNLVFWFLGGSVASYTLAVLTGLLLPNTGPKGLAVFLLILLGGLCLLITVGLAIAGLIQAIREGIPWDAI